MNETNKFKDVCGDSLQVIKTEHGLYQFETYGTPELADWQVKEVIGQLQSMLNEKAKAKQ